MAERKTEVEYMIEQKIFSNLWMDKDNFTALIFFIKENHKEEFVGWFNKVAHHFAADSIDYTIDDFEFINRKINNVEFFIIKMPDAIEEGLAHYVIFTYDFNIRQRIYFLIEKGNEVQDYFLCSVVNENHLVQKINPNTEIGQLVEELMNIEIQA